MLPVSITLKVYLRSVNKSLYYFSVNNFDIDVYYEKNLESSIHEVLDKYSNDALDVIEELFCMDNYIHLDPIFSMTISVHNEHENWLRPSSGVSKKLLTRLALLGLSFSFSYENFSNLD